jgi:hypothetical protein
LRVWRQRGGGLSKRQRKASKRRRGGHFGRRGAAWRSVASIAAAWRVAGFFYMNQQLARGLQNFSTRETQKKMFHGEKINVFLDPPPWVFGKKNGRVIFSGKLFLKTPTLKEAHYFFAHPCIHLRKQP